MLKLCRSELTWQLSFELESEKKKNYLFDDNLYIAF